jgi:hypothetical protein
MRKTAKYKRQDYKTNEDIVSEIKIDPAIKKIQNYSNKWIQHVCCMDRDRLTNSYEMPPHGSHNNNTHHRCIYSGTSVHKRLSS